MVKIFVYGTLLEGRANHHILQDGEGIGPVSAVLEDHALYRVTTLYPGIVPKPGRKILG